MKKVTIKPLSTIVAQLPAGIEVNAVQDEQGNVYVPVLNVPATGGGKSADMDAALASAKPPKKETSASIPTEEEMMEMETKDLEKLCAELGIDPNKTEGKNTHKKLRSLILESASAAPEKKPVKKVVEEEKEEEEVPKKPSLKDAKKKAEPEEEEVEAEDLEKGDEVRVYWKNLKEWYDGVVKSVKGGNVIIYYEADDTEEAIDPKIHTQIMRKAGVEV